MDKLKIMKHKLNILITGAGSPGIMGTIFSLKNNYDSRSIHIISTDANPNVVGKYIADDFIQVPLAKKGKEYLDAMFNICLKKKIDVLIPQNTAELVLLSSNKDLFDKCGTKILISDPNAIRYANDKFELMKLCSKLNIPVAKFELVDTFEKLKLAAMEIGWPKRKVVIKPTDSNGSRGVRIIDESIDLKNMFFEEKPTSLYIKMNSLYDVLGDSFSNLLVMEYLPGKEYTVDAIRKSDYCEIIPRSRDLVRSGITFNGSLENNQEIIKYSKILANNLNLEYCFGFQFKLDENNIPKIIESNPRVQGTMVMSTLSGANLIYSSVKLLLDEKLPEFSIDWSTKFYRYWGGLGICQSGNKKVMM